MSLQKDSPFVYILSSLTKRRYKFLSPRSPHYTYFFKFLCIFPVIFSFLRVVLPWFFHQHKALSLEKSQDTLNMVSKRFFTILRHFEVKKSLKTSPKSQILRSSRFSVFVFFKCILRFSCDIFISMCSITLIFSPAQSAES